MNNLPKDPVMLLSYVNTQLRDNYSNFEDFCQAFNADKSDIEGKLNAIDYHYDSATNQFK